MCQDFFANGSHYSSTGDTLTVYHYILEFTPLGYLNLILVALVSIMVLYKISKIFNCGEAKTMLVRESYLKFKKNLVKAIRNEIDKEYRKVEDMKNIL